jgi:hypothetical protein
MLHVACCNVTPCSFALKMRAVLLPVCQINMALYPRRLKLSHLRTVSDIAFEFLFSGPVLPSDSDIYSVPLVRSREKQLLVASILDSFSNLLPSATYLRTNINTGMGFLLGDFLLSDQ